MRKLKTHKSIWLIYWITNITFWIYCAVVAVITVLAVVLLFNGFGGDLNLNVQLPANFNVIEEGSLTSTSFQTNVKLVQASGMINFTELPKQLSNLFAIYMLLLMAITFYLFLMFRTFIRNVYKGIVFKKSNIQLLKKISYGLVVFWGVIVSYTIIQYAMVIQNLEFKTIEITGDINFYPSILLGALFLWVLSHIFMHGAQLEEESNLTI